MLEIKIILTVSIAHHKIAAISILQAGLYNVNQRQAKFLILPFISKECDFIFIDFKLATHDLLGALFLE